MNLPDPLHLGAYLGTQEGNHGVPHMAPLERIAGQGRDHGHVQERTEASLFTHSWVNITDYCTKKPLAFRIRVVHKSVGRFQISDGEH